MVEPLHQTWRQVVGILVKADDVVEIIDLAGTLGILIPPSVILVLYGVATQTDIGKLFIAGIVPGILMCLCLGIAAYLVAVKRGYGGEAFPGWPVLAMSFLVAIPGLLTAIIIVGGVLSGVMTVTESGAVGAIYAVAVTTLVSRELAGHASMGWDSARVFGLQLGGGELTARMADGLTSPLVAFPVNSTNTVFVARFTGAFITPGCAINMLCTLFTQLAQVIPVTGNVRFTVGTP